jgi:hypothetical protein
MAVASYSQIKDGQPRLNRADSIIEIASLFHQWVTTDVKLKDDDDWRDPDATPRGRRGSPSSGA